MKRAAGAILAVACACAHAQDVSLQQPDALALLRKMAGAARQLTYEGTFVFKQGGHTETSRIWHLVDAAGEFERLETLDGPPREVVRTNDEVTCYYPAIKTAKVEKRAGRRFPAVVSDQLASVASNYTVRRGELDRVAGHDCQITLLEPRDRMRYGHAFCLEVGTGLPLRAKAFNEKNEVVEHFAFTQISIGGGVTREHVKPRYSAKDPGWKLERTMSTAEGERESGWEVTSLPPGFRKVLEVRRSIQGKSAAQLVYSDGLAAISVFVEPAVAGLRPASDFAQQGAINIFTRGFADHVVTALGEAPATTVMQFGSSVSFRPRPAQ